MKLEVFREHRPPPNASIIVIRRTDKQSNRQTDRSENITPFFGGGNETLTDPGMGGPGAPPPLTKTRGSSWLREAVCPRHEGELSLKTLTFGPSFNENGQKAFSFMGLRP